MACERRSLRVGNSRSPDSVTLDPLAPIVSLLGASEGAVDEAISLDENAQSLKGPLIKT